MAIGLLKLSLVPNQKALVHNLDDPAEIWTKLCDTFEKKKTNRRLALMLELLNSKVEDENNISSYLNKITDLKNKLEELKQNSIDDALLFAIIMSKLPAAFATFQTIYGRDEVMEAETFDGFKNLILAEDAKLKHHGLLGGSGSSQALAMKTQRREAPKEEKITQRSGESSQDKKKFNGKCNYCKKDGHREKNCWFKRRDKRKGNQDDKGKSVAAHCV